jgi:hypothetical protein
MNNELEKMWNEATMTYFNVSHHSMASRYRALTIFRVYVRWSSWSYLETGITYTEIFLCVPLLFCMDLTDARPQGCIWQHQGWYKRLWFSEGGQEITIFSCTSDACWRTAVARTLRQGGRTPVEGYLCLSVLCCPEYVRGLPISVRAVLPNVSRINGVGMNSESWH